MPSIYQPRRPRASPLWQVVHHGWSDFLTHYESKYRSSLGPLDRSAEVTAQAFMRCGDLASGFTRLKCPCCPGAMKVMRTMLKREEVEFFLKLQGLWEGLVCFPRQPPPTFDIEQHRGIGGVLDGGIAVARRVNTPCGAC